jgi:hypothetical protein
MRFIDKEGVRAGELEALARTRTNLNSLVRRGYVVVDPAPADSLRKPTRSNWVG